MKHAILIIAHNNIQHLMRLVSYFDSNYQVYIHLNRKWDISKQERSTLSDFQVVKGIYSRYSINWGGFKILKASIFLLKKAVKDKDNGYFHLLSGQDYPIKPIETFTKFMEANDGKEFLEYHTLPYNGWENGTYRRYEYFSFYDFFDYKTEKGYQWITKIYRFQKKFNIKRRIPHHFETIYGGACWFTLSRDCVCYILEYTRKHPAFFRRLKYTFVPEETYFHTIILNSSFKEKTVNRSLRYVDWCFRNGNYPANLDESDFTLLSLTDAFFARKFIEKVSDKLIKLIDDFLIFQEVDSGINITQNQCLIKKNYE